MATIMPARQNRLKQAVISNRGQRFVSAARAVLGETQKGLWLMWRHRIIVLLELLAMTIFYPFFQFILGNGTIQRALVSPTLLAFMAFPLLYITAFKTMSDLLEEVNSGTFEQIHLSPFSPAWLLLGRITASVIEGVVIAGCIAVLVAWMLGVSLPLEGSGLVPAALIVMDCVGFALLIGGVALVLPQFSAILSLFAGLTFILNGSFIPVEQYPIWVQAVARLLPTTLGIEVLREVVLQGQSLATVWASGTLPLLLVHAILLMALGWLVFVMTDRRASQRGSLR